MLKTIKSTVFILGFLVGFLGCQYVYDAIRIKRLNQSNNEIKAMCNEVISIAKENQALAENWKTLYQLADTDDLTACKNATCKSIYVYSR